MYSAFGVDHGEGISKSFKEYRKANRDYRKHKKESRRDYLSKPGVAAGQGVAGGALGFLAGSAMYDKYGKPSRAQMAQSFKNNHYLFSHSKAIPLGIAGAGLAYGGSKYMANKSKKTTMN